MGYTEEILLLYERDQKAALQLLFDIYYESLLLYCYRIIGDTESAEDVVQECFVHIWSSSRLTDFKGKLDHFMFQSVKYRALNCIRDRERRILLYDRASLENSILPAINIEDEEGQEIELLYRTINRLPDKCRKIFFMACLDDMKYQEIAYALQVSINTVKTQMKIALRFLRENLDKDSFSSILLFLSYK